MLGVILYKMVENFISKQNNEAPGGENMPKVLIATLFHADAVLIASHRLSPDRLFLLVDEIPTKEQEKALKIIKESLGKVIEVKPVKVPKLDIVGVTERCVQLIDVQPDKDVIYANITSGIKTVSLGLLYAAYCRPDKVKKIAYNPDEDKKSVVYLPKLTFKLTLSQKTILKEIEKHEFENLTEFGEKIELSTGMLYRALNELKDHGFVDTDDNKGWVLTDAGKIARL